VIARRQSAGVSIERRNQAPPSMSETSFIVNIKDVNIH